MADGRHVGKYWKCHNSPTVIEEICVIEVMIPRLPLIAK